MVTVADTLAAKMRDERSPCQTSADQNRFDVPVETGKLVLGNQIADHSLYMLVADADAAA